MYAEIIFFFTISNVIFFILITKINIFETNSIKKILKTSIMDNKQKVLDAFKNSGKPLKSAEISEKTGIDKKEVDKIIKELKTQEVIYSPKVCFYDLKK